MSKRKYKVGQRYEVNCDDRKGNIIEITDVDSQYAYYRTIKRQRGLLDVFHFFEQGSNFEKSLKPLKNESIVIYRKGQEVIALDKTTGKKAVAKCCPDDEFDFNTGAKLAFDRLLGVEQPKYKEVKRNAEKGEYIKVVNPNNVPDGEYKKGDILKVVRTIGGNAWYGEGHAKDGRSRYLHKEEYVVLEGFQPPKEEKKEGCFKVLCIKDHKIWCDLSFVKGKVYEFINGDCKRDDGGVSSGYASFEDLLSKNRSYKDVFIELKDGDDPQEIMKKYNFFSGKVVCVNSKNSFCTKGKVYEFKDGYSTNDDGEKMPYCTRIKNVNHLNDVLYSDFIEMVE
jgi:hypothetical protein